MDPRPSLNNLELQTIPGTQWKELCRELGLRQTGRKDDLRERVVNFLSTDDGRRRVGDATHNQLLLRVVQLAGGVLTSPRPPVAPTNLAPSIQYTKLCICGGSATPTGLPCRRCGAVQHFSCVGKAAAMARFECALCQFQQMEPYEPIVEVVLPPSLPCTQGQPVSSRQFRYTEEMSRKLSVPGHPRYLQIRSIRLDDQGYTYHWPKDCSIVLNGKTVCNFTQPPTTSARKRKDTALLISQLAVGTNDVMVLRQREEATYAFGIFIIEKLTPEAVLANMSKEAELAEEAGKAFVMGRVGGSDEVTTNSYRQSLKCPLTRLIPETPARGTHCRHIQCFDLQPYIIMQEKAKVNRWRCPVCSTLVLSVVIDVYMRNILKQAMEIGATAVEFGTEAEFTLVKEEEDEDEMDSDVENHVGMKRAAPPTEAPPPTKRSTPFEPRLVWSDFVQSTSYIDCVSLDLLHSTVAYQNAYQKSISMEKPTATPPRPKEPVRIEPRPQQQRRELGKSVECPIEIDD